MKNLKFIHFGCILFALLVFSTAGIAQRKISGVVEDGKNNNPLEGATIAVKAVRQIQFPKLMENLN